MKEINFDEIINKVIDDERAHGVFRHEIPLERYMMEAWYLGYEQAMKTRDIVVCPNCHTVVMMQDIE